MTSLLIVEPVAIAEIVASRGTGANNLRSPDPKEVWADSATGAMSITVDLGRARSVDTVWLGNVRGASSGTAWTITGGIAAGDELVIQPSAPLRVPDNAGEVAEISSALWSGTPVDVRFVVLTIVQPAGSPLLTAGILAIGRAWSAALGIEWGSGRRPIDTGTATALPSGGFAVTDGVRKRALSWTFGDLSQAEADQLEAIALRLGVTQPALIVEDATRTEGLRGRCWWGLFLAWRAFDRRNVRQTRWELTFEEWK